MNHKKDSICLGNFITVTCLVLCVAGFLHFPVSMIGRWVLGVLPQLLHAVYNLLLALDFLLRSLSPQGL